MHDDMPSADDSMTEAREALRGYIQSKVADLIADAVSARRSSGIEQIWIEDEDQYEGVDHVTQGSQVITSKAQPRSKAPTEATRSRVVLNITRPKVDNWTSRVQEMLLPHDDKPWAIEATPVPEIDEAAESGDQTPVMLADGTQAAMADVAKAAKEAARVAADRMTEQVEDWFVEGHLYAELRKVIRDAGRAGIGWIKGPIPERRVDRRWRKGPNGSMVIEVSERIVPISRRKSYWDVFPDPSCGSNHQDGAYMVDRDYWTAKTLRKWAQTPGVDRKAVAECLREGPGNVARQDDRSSRQREGETRTTDATVFEVFHIHLELNPVELVGSGWAAVRGVNDAAQVPIESDEKAQEAIALQREELDLAAVPIIATVINERLVYMAADPSAEDGFPFDRFVPEEIEGQVYGRSVARKMATPQRMLTAATRALLENAGMSAGPQIVAADCIEPADQDGRITGRKLWRFSPSDEIDDVRKAFGVFIIPSVQKELQAIIDFSMRMAEETTNMPAMLQGLMGNAPDTVGGLKLQQSNASSPLKAAAKSFDDLMMVPHLRRYYAWAMADESVPQEAKGDLQCKARGSTALVQREDGALFLASSYPMTADPELRINKERWFAELCKAHRISPASVQYTDSEWKTIQEAKAQQPQPEDPRVQVAQIAADAKLQGAKLDADRDTLYQQSLQTREETNQAFRERELELKERLAILELAMSEKLSLEDAKVQLAETAMKLRTQKELAGMDGTGPQVTTPPTEPPQHAPEGQAYQQ